MNGNTADRRAMPAQDDKISLEDAGSYMARKELFQLFESLLTGILYNRPERPVEFLDLCIQRARKHEPLTWDSFLNVLQENEEIKPFSATNSESELRKDVKEAFSSMFPTQPEIKDSQD